MTLLPLDGYVVAVTADRRAEEQAELLRRRGAMVILAPTIATEYLASDEDVRSATLAAIEASPEYVVFLTGIGLRAWVEAAQSWGLDARLLSTLRRAKILTRGPKATAAATTVGLTPWRSATSEQAEELVTVLRAEVRAGERVVLQRHGGAEARFAEALRGRGAELLEVPVYRWRVPADIDHVRSVIEDVIARKVHAVTFTSAPALQNLLLVADDGGDSDRLRDAFNSDVVAACVGPVCASFAREAGIGDPAFPDVGRLGLMIRELSSRLAGSALATSVRGVEVELHGRVVVVAGERRELTPGEERVLRELLGARGAVTPAPEPVIRRLRRKLGPAADGVETVRRRGYRLAMP